MAGTYKIFGKTVQSHQLAIATLLTVGAIGFGMSKRNSSVPIKAPVNTKGVDNKDTGSDDIDIEKLINELTEGKK